MAGSLGRLGLVAEPSDPPVVTSQWREKVEEAVLASCEHSHPSIV